METKMKRLKIYGEKDDFKGFIAEIYVKDNEVIVESKDKEVKEILETEIGKAIERVEEYKHLYNNPEEARNALGILLRTGGNREKVFIDRVKLYLWVERDGDLGIKILEDQNGKAKQIIKKINESQEYYQKTINKWLREMCEKFRPTGDLKKDWFSERDWVKKWSKKNPLAGRSLSSYIKDQLKANGYNVQSLGGIHYFGSEFVKINDPKFINHLKGFIFSQREDRHGKHHPAPAKKIRDLGYYVSSFKSLVVDE